MTISRRNGFGAPALLLLIAACGGLSDEDKEAIAEQACTYTESQLEDEFREVLSDDEQCLGGYSEDPHAEACEAPAGEATSWVCTQCSTSTGNVCNKTSTVHVSVDFSVENAGVTYSGSAEGDMGYKLTSSFENGHLASDEGSGEQLSFNYYSSVASATVAHKNGFNGSVEVDGYSGSYTLNSTVECAVSIETVLAKTAEVAEKTCSSSSSTGSSGSSSSSGGSSVTVGASTGVGSTGSGYGGYGGSGGYGGYGGSGGYGGYGGAGAEEAGSGGFGSYGSSSSGYGMN